MDWDDWESVTDWVDEWRSDGEDTADGGEEESLFDPLAYDPETLGVRADITTELGLLPAEFVRQVIEAEGGRIRQQDFDKYADFSASTVCRMLQELEAEGEIKRFRFGREKIVALAERTISPPESSATATDIEPLDGGTEGGVQNSEVSDSW